MEEDKGPGCHNNLKMGPVRGGILCENMGSGKTLMVIGLIAATLNKGARLFDARWNVEVAAAPLHLPNLDNHENTLVQWSARSSLDGSVVYYEPVAGKPMPSLVQLCLATIKLQNSATINEHIATSLPEHIEKPYQNLQHFITSDFIQHSTRSIHSRAASEPTPNQSSTHRIHLSKTTLIVVPDTLIRQWRAEFSKHVLPGEINVLDLENTKTSIPQPTDLIAYDVILITHSRLSQEDTKFGFEFKGVDRSCRCPYKGATRIVDCKCELIQSILKSGSLKSKSKKKVVHGYISPLIQVYFQRLVFDEGHLLKHESAGETKLLDTVAKLKAHWKWVCSGTPLPNILDNGEVVDKKRRMEMEKLDLRKLSGIVGNYLKIEPFCHDKNIFSREVSAPWLSGKDIGLERVQHLFNSLVVRHQIEDIQNQHPLPPLHEKTVYLKMNQHERINTNILIAQIKLNSVLTEREGVDYFGHPSMRDALHEVVYNLKLSHFNFNGIEIVSQAKRAAENALSGLTRAVVGEKSYDCNLLTSVISHLQRAEDAYYDAKQQISTDILYVVKECRCLWKCGGFLDDGLPVALVDFRNGRRLLTKEQIEKHATALKIAKLNSELESGDLESSGDLGTNNPADSTEAGKRSFSVESEVALEPVKKKLKMIGEGDVESHIVGIPKKKKRVAFAFDSMDIDEEKGNSDFTIPSPVKMNSTNLGSTSGSHISTKTEKLLKMAKARINLPTGVSKNVSSRSPIVSLTSEEKSKCKKVLRTLMHAENSIWFADPVDPVLLGIPEYFDIIKEPMDFRTLKKLLKEGRISSVAEFRRLGELIFQNAINFNHSTNQIHRDALMLFDLLRTEMNKNFGSAVIAPIMETVPVASASSSSTNNHITTARKEAHLEMKESSQIESTSSAPKAKPCKTCLENPKLSFTIEASTCTKLTYIADQILKYHKTEKIIIYTTLESEMHSIREFCELAGVKSLLFMKSRQATSQKADNVLTFNTTGQDIPVFIMDVSKAAFGLDLSTASRIYFLRPVAETAIYKQAIKRAHRLGCTKPVYVETLAFEGTLEVSSQVDANKKGNGFGKEKVSVADLKMKDMIDVAPFVMGDSPDVGGLSDLFTPDVRFTEPFVKRI
ncbi:hypothetical protein BCR33DRAFT_710861 [Rhizoclosmatium globosum]|uniref:Bromo domain-containing protein n=1 Tax=Rhizoclosmatium globosum TaxID=329046 RepID=A0A1Y2D2T9_9FUNG|nr:hypothetical protein BCR33DRAFT_710861 [Rhizoclosmatium globosum]|eukprot:ORY53426.1 hypothetical protein BCR33DRAFT_710861 [Rhizoclosmatium globosum]